ncbi:MAG: phosphatase [Gammaproteobacteria bacterium]|nr:MAG: phosphatase [Gammaproteobacteria bacterium]
MALGEIRNFLHPLPGVYSSGQPLAHQFNEIAAAGVQAVINLALADSEGALPHEGGLVTSLGMDYFHLPVSFEAPTLERLRLFCDLMRVLEGRCLWVHCVLNWRVSAFLYLYHRRILGWNEEESSRFLLPGWQPDGVWRGFIDRALEARF